MRKFTDAEKKSIDEVAHLISDYRTELEALTLVKDEYLDDCDPIMIEAETSGGYYCQMMAAPKPVAQILLRYDYPIYAVLGEEPPQAMWDDLASHFGVASVTSFDL